VAVVCAVFLTSCGDDAHDSALAERRAARLADDARVEQPQVVRTGVVKQVAAIDNTFRPQVIEIAVGDEVVWENRGQNEHDVLSVVEATWGVEVASFQPGDVWAHVFTEPGEYAYYCSIHGNETAGMIGTVIVSG
jgi:plastocyanin